MVTQRPPDLGGCQLAGAESRVGVAVVTSSSERLFLIIVCLPKEKRLHVLLEIGKNEESCVFGWRIPQLLGAKELFINVY